MSVPAYKHSLFVRLRSNFWRAVTRYTGAHVCAVYRREIKANCVTTPPAGVEVRLGELAELSAYTTRAEYGLSKEFLHRAFFDNHEVVLTYYQAALAAYGWVSYGRTPHSRGWYVEFGKGHRYNYKNFTLPAYRGKRLRGSFGILNDRDEKERATHTIAFIELQNHSSIRAEGRNGGQRVGFAGYVDWGPWHWAFCSSGAKRHGFRFLRIEE